jgi:DNA-directed RNA polymerase specialized sigma24 family protein
MVFLVFFVLGLVIGFLLSAWLFVVYTSTWLNNYERTDGLRRSGAAAAHPDQDHDIPTRYAPRYRRSVTATQVIPGHYVEDLDVGERGV